LGCKHQPGNLKIGDNNVAHKKLKSIAGKPEKVLRVIGALSSVPINKVAVKIGNK
jgi:hypothetical protein